MRSARHQILELKPRTDQTPNSSSPNLPGPEKKQTSKLRIALAVLLVALIAVLVRDREFWFGSDEASSPVAENLPAASPSNTVTNPAPVQPAPAANQAVANSTVSSSSTPLVARNEKAVKTESHKEAPPKVAGKRASLPPLEVDVIAAHDKSTRVENKVVTLPNDTERAASTAQPNLPTNAAEREPLTTAAAPEIHQTINSSYPLLGPSMKVRGAVVLQAIIGSDGVIENLRVVSGPAILTTAAQQAVREWRFKPYMSNGQAVETKATITVNFSIQIADNASKTS